MSCGDKKLNTCGKKTYSACVIYEKPLSVHTHITDLCYSEEEVIKDLSVQVDEIFSNIDMTGLTNTCSLVFPTIRTVKSVMQMVLDTLCTQSATITAQGVLITNLQTAVTALQNTPCP